MSLEKFLEDIPEMSEELSLAYDEMMGDTKSDRTTVILCCALLEDRVNELLIKTLRPSIKGGGLEKGRSSWSKVTAAFQIGLLPKEVTEAMYLLLQIRNRFAHRPTEVILEGAEDEKFVYEFKSLALAAAVGLGTKVPSNVEAKRGWNVSNLVTGFAFLHLVLEKCIEKAKPFHYIAPAEAPSAHIDSSGDA